MRNTILVLDCNYLCYRAYFAMGQLRYKNMGTGVIFGFMRDVVNLQQLHQSTRMVFCFDHGRPKRLEHWADYKAGRHDNLTDLEREQRAQMKIQVNLIRKEILPDLGFRNVFAEKGFEADDLIASIVGQLDRRDEAIMVSRDKDLYQLLNKRVMLWDPHNSKMYSANSFRKEYGVEPSQWIDIKSIAGCSSDNIPGIKGVGEKTAAKFLTGKLKKESKAWTSIVKGSKTWKLNKVLVELPFPGTPTFDLAEDKISHAEWRRMVEKFGMRSLEDYNGEAKKKKQGRQGFGL